MFNSIGRLNHKGGSSPLTRISTQMQLQSQKRCGCVCVWNFTTRFYTFAKKIFTYILIAHYRICIYTIFRTSTHTIYIHTTSLIQGPNGRKQLIDSEEKEVETCPSIPRFHSCSHSGHVALAQGPAQRTTEQRGGPLTQT